MRVYTCNADWESMLTTIYRAFESGLGHKNIRLMIEPVQQYSLFDEYIHVDSNSELAVKVMDSINQKLSPYVYQELAITAMAYEEDALDNIYHVLILGFTYGADILNRLQFKDVMRNREIRKRVGGEICRFHEITRFHQIGNVFIAHIEPKSRIVEALGPIFQDRMPSENFIIVDDVHLQSVVHHANEHYYMQRLSESELKAVLRSEEINDEFTDLWRAFFKSIAIKERENPRCQQNLFPLWARGHAVEFV